MTSGMMESNGTQCGSDQQRFNALNSNAEEKEKKYETQGTSAERRHNSHSLAVQRQILGGRGRQIKHHLYDINMTV